MFIVEFLTASWFSYVTVINSHIIIMKSFKHSQDLQSCNFNTLWVDNSCQHFRQAHIPVFLFSISMKIKMEMAKGGKKVRFFSHAFHFPSKPVRSRAFTPQSLHLKKKWNATAKTYFLKSPSRGGKEITTEEPDKQIFHPLRESVQFYHLPLTHV